MRNLKSRLATATLFLALAAPVGFAVTAQVPPIPERLSSHYATRLNGPDKFNAAAASAVKGSASHALFSWMGGDRVSVTDDSTGEWKTLSIRGIADTPHLVSSNIRLSVKDEMGQIITNEYYEVGAVIPPLPDDNNVYLIFNRKGNSAAKTITVTVIDQQGMMFDSEPIPYLAQ